MAENYRPANASTDQLKTSVYNEMKGGAKTEFNLSRIYKMAFAATILIGLLLEVLEWSQSQLFVRWWKTTFYTVQSNTILCIYVFRSLVLSPSRTTVFTKPCLVVMISVTGVVWHLILKQHIDLTGYPMRQRIATHILHTVAPLMAWIDWILFDKKGTMKKRFALGFLITPLLYLCFSYTRAYFGGPLGVDPKNGFPFYHWYRFIEPEQPLRLYPGALLDHRPGWVVVINCCLIALTVLLFGLGFIALDKAMKPMMKLKCE